MYKDFFGLTDYPFSLTPDPKFLVFTSSYYELLAGLYYGIEMSKGLIVLTGEVGTGKTTALRWIIHRLDSSVLAAYIYYPHLSVEEFYHHVAKDLGIGENLNKADLLIEMAKVLEDRSRRGLRTILIVDEAHELSDEVLEEIRLLLNFESDNTKHLQIILTGQPELKDRINQTNLRQLKQRVALRCKMPEIEDVAALENYISTRLSIGGAEKTDLFTPDALDLIFQASKGIPRLINSLCDNSLILAFASDDKKITRRTVEEVADNLELLPSRERLVASERASISPMSGQTLTSKGKQELLDDVKFPEFSGFEE